MSWSGRYQRVPSAMQAAVVQPLDSGASMSDAVRRHSPSSNSRMPWVPKRAANRAEQNVQVARLVRAGQHSVSDLVTQVEVIRRLVQQADGRVLGKQGGTRRAAARRPTRWQAASAKPAVRRPRARLRPHNRLLSTASVQARVTAGQRSRAPWPEMPIRNPKRTPTVARAGDAVSRTE